jgi:tRNA(fMet)-specific endonuclease VapC
VVVKIAVDTNRYRDLCEGKIEALDVLSLAETVFIPLPVLAELRSGFACGSLSRKNEATLTTFLNEPRVRILCPDEQSTFFYARLYRQLRVQGTPIPTHDLWIAALVEQHQLILYTRDRHFDHLPQLARIS